MSNVLITGGSGLIGQHLSTLLSSKGFTVGYLTRSESSSLDNIKLFKWDINRGELDEQAIIWADHIIHLAGETVGQRWTKSVKDRIIQSRVNSTLLLIKGLKNKNHHLKSFISASAIGYYGEDTADELLSESSPLGTGFLPNVAGEWEAAVDGVSDYTERLAKIRIGIVLAKEGGAFAKMMMPIKWGVGSALGTGNQWMSWIHIDDLCNMFLQALEKPLIGVYNGVGPNPVTNKEFTKILAQQLRKPIFLPNVPSFALKLLLGKMAVLALGSNKVEPIAFQKEGFTFEFATLNVALESLI